MKKNYEEKIKNDILMAAITLICFIVYTILVKTVNIGQIEGAASEVGFMDFNKIFFNAFGFNELFYKLSKYLGFMVFVVVIFFVLMGAFQLFTRKSLKKVDPEIYGLAGFYAAVFFMYILFEKLVINYRPVIVDADEGLEASFPSTHTMLAICIFSSGIVMLNRYVKNETLRMILTIVFASLGILIVVFRFLSGVHWATDIIGGILLSAFLFSLFVLTINYIDSKKN